MFTFLFVLPLQVHARLVAKFTGTKRVFTMPWRWSPLVVHVHNQPTERPSIHVLAFLQTVPNTATHRTPSQCGTCLDSVDAGNADHHLNNGREGQSGFDWKQEIWNVRRQTASLCSESLSRSPSDNEPRMNCLLRIDTFKQVKLSNETNLLLIFSDSCFARIYSPQNRRFPSSGGPYLAPPWTATPAAPPRPRPRRRGTPGSCRRRPQRNPPSAPCPYRHLREQEKMMTLETATLLFVLSRCHDERSKDQAAGCTNRASSPWS